MQRVNNMGSLLQSYGLKKMLENEGAEVDFLDIKKIDEDFKLLNGSGQDYSYEFGEKGLISKLKKIDSYLLNRIKIKQLIKHQEMEYDAFRKGQLNIDKKSQKYDLCVIGSDEVFNCLNAGDWGFTSQLFGNVPEAGRVITYAASCGSTVFEELPKAVENRIRWSFENISAFSVRDENTNRFLRNLTNKDVSINLDPVLIYDFEKEIKKEKLPDLPERYCIIYSYYNRIHTKEEIGSIIQFCKRHKLVPIAIGSPQFWIKNYVVSSPFQCLKVFENAEFVITDTFHGTIFSVKYAKNFAVLLRASNNNKLGDLVRRLDFRNHVIQGFDELEMIYAVKKDEQTIKKMIETERRKTKSYLNSNLRV